MKDQKESTALFFGSFDPIHMGHLIIAEYFVNLDEISELWFVLSPCNPFKQDQLLTPESIRKELLDAAIEEEDRFRVCDVEFAMEAPNYTYKTIEVLKEKYPQRSFILLIGGDNLSDFDKWKNHHEILQTLPVYVYPRRGFQNSAFDHYPNLRKTNAPIVEISSTLIKKNLAEGLSARFLLPPGVYDLVRKKRLYI